MTQVLFVCMGNICRSPAAEAVMRSMVDRSPEAQEVTCDSAGTIGIHTGNPPDERMRETALRRGISVGGRARKVTPADLDIFDLVLAMDEDNFEDLQSIAAGDPKRSAKIRRFCEFCSTTDASSVPDPYYGGEEGFELVMDLLEDGCSNLLRGIGRGEIDGITA